MTGSRLGRNGGTAWNHMDFYLATISRMARSGQKTRQGSETMAVAADLRGDLRGWTPQVAAPNRETCIECRFKRELSVTYAERAASEIA